MNTPTISTAACDPVANLPTVATATCDPDPNIPTVDTATCDPSPNIPTVSTAACEIFRSAEVTGTANCPVGQTGSEVQVVVPVGQYDSFESQAAANALAQAYADELAESQLSCLWLNSVAGESTAVCPEGTSGSDVTVVIAIGEVTGETLEEANANAQAQAEEEAEAALVCECIPVLIGEVTPAISATPPATLPVSSFGSQPAGTYEVRYKTGAMKYAANACWYLNLGTLPSSGFRVTHRDGVGGVVTVEGPTNGNPGCQATEAAVWAYHAGAAITIVHGTTGNISVFLADFPYDDNVAGTPGPTFELWRMCP